MDLQSSNLSLKLLGGSQIFLNARPLRELTAAKSRAILFYLAVTNRPASRDALAGLLWPEMPDADAKTNLRQALNKLNKLLPQQLAITRQEVGLRPKATVVLDVAAFESAWQAGEREQDMEQLREAAALYQGDFLDGFHIADAEPFEEWVLLERERLRGLALQTFHALASYYTLRRETALGLQYTGRLLQLEPWREETHQQMMRLLAWDGQVTAALAQYNTCKKMLAEELGIEPLPGTTMLYERILALRQSPRDNLPLEATPFVGRAEQLAELTRRLHDPACRLVTLTGPGGVGKTRLALQAATRQRNLFLDGVYYVELAELTTQAQVVPAIGAAVGYRFSGSGAAASQLLHYLRPKEMLLVLDNFEHLLHDAQPDAIDFLSHLLQAAPDIKLLVTSRERLNLLEEWVFELDGLPYPHDAADPQVEAYECVQLFAQVARRGGAAFDLMAEKKAVVEICQLVQGLPLAIYLAASLLRVQTGRQIATEIAQNMDVLATTVRNVPERQQSIRATLEYSWALLDKTERSLLAQLSVFRGGFNRQAAAVVVAMAGASGVGDDPTTFAALSSLVDKSLLRLNDNGRYELHDLVCQFAAEQLMKDGALLAETARRHGDYYLVLAGEQGEALNGPHMATAVAIIGREQDNLRVAWRWAIGRIADELHQSLEAACIGLTRYYLTVNQYWEGEHLFQQAYQAVESVLSVDPASVSRLRPFQARLQTSLARLFVFHRHYDEAIAAAETALSLASECEANQLVIRNHYHWGIALYQQGDYVEARRHIEEGIFLAQQARLSLLEATGYQYRGSLEYYLANYPQSLTDYEKALAYYERQRPRFPRQRATLYNNLGNVHLRFGDFDRAKSYYQRVLALRQDGHQGRIGGVVTINNLGLVALAQGDFMEARRCFEEALRGYRHTGNQQGEGMVLGNLGELYRQLGLYQRARDYFEQDMALMQRIGRQGRIGIRLANLGLVHLHLGKVDEAIGYGRQAVEEAEKRGEQNTLAVALLFLGYIHTARGEWAEATAAHQQAFARFQTLGQEKLALEALAGLAGLALEQEQLDEAREYVSPITEYLQHGRLEGVYNPFRVYLTCYRVLAAAEDGRAEALGQLAHDLLQEQAARIEDERLKHSFLSVHQER